MNLLWVVVVSRINVQAYSERFESSECTYIRIKYMWFLCEYWNIDETSFFLRTYLFWKLALIENFKINDVFLSIPFSSSSLILDNRSSTFFLLPLGFSSLCYRSTVGCVTDPTVRYYPYRTNRRTLLILILTKCLELTLNKN